MNQLILIGKIKELPQIKETTNGITVGRLTVEVKKGRKSGEQAGENESYQFTLWRTLAEEVEKNAVIGANIAIKGRLQANNFTKDNGEIVYRSDLIAEKVCFIE